VLSNYANLLMLQKQTKKAFTHLETALRLMIQHRGVDADATTRIRACLAACHVDLGNFKKASKLYDQIQASKVKLYGAGHQELVVVYNGMAASRFKRLEKILGEKKFKSSDIAEVVTLYKKSVSILETTFGKDDVMLVPTLNNLIAVYSKNERVGLDLAKRNAENVLRILRIYGRQTSAQAESAHLVMARCAKRDEDIEAEAEHYTQVLAIRSNKYGENSPQMQNIRAKLQPIQESAAMVKELEEKVKRETDGSEKWGRIMYELAETLYGMDMIHKAQATVEHAMSKYHEDPTTDELAGDLDELANTIHEDVEGALAVDQENS
jgi:tetratricopeptide (TPR) repeat protein